MTGVQRLRLGLLLSVVLIAALAVGAGLVRAAFYQANAATPVTGGPTATPAGTTGTCAGQPAQAARELRGMWLTTVYNLDFPSKPGLSEAQVKAEYERWLDLAVAQNHNAIFVHVRPSGDSFWPSDHAPWSNWLTGRFDGKSPGWDPMAFMVAEAHARGLEFHAWFNPYRGTQPAPSGVGTDAAKLAPNHPLRLHPEWRVAYPSGKTGRFYFDPGIPAARKFVEDSMIEAVQKYDVDGVHFDDFFYPYPEGSGQDFPDAASFKKYGAGKSKGDWRRDNVNLLVKEMHDRLQQIKPWVKFGISPFGIWRNKATDAKGSASNGLESYDTIYADTRTWVKSGWLDYIAPQLYWTIGFKKADYPTLLKWWTDLTKGTNVQLYIGMADYRVGEAGDWSRPAMLDQEMDLNDKYGVQGEIHFSATQVRDDKLGAVTKYRKAHYNSPALQPRLARLAATPPPPPQLTAVKRDPAGRLIFTSAGLASTNWALYRTTNGPATLVTTGRTGGEIADRFPVPDGKYCLSALDRNGYESPLSAALTAPVT